MDKFASSMMTAGVWALDFIRAYNERPFLCKILARFIFGKYAYSEFVGLIKSLNDSQHDPFFEYCLNNVDYPELDKKLRWWTV